MGENKISYHKKYNKQEEITAFLFILPFIIGFVVFGIIPIFISFSLSLVDFNKLMSVSQLNTLKFVGLKNFMDVIKDPIAMSSFGRTFLYSAIYVPVLLVSSLAFALLLNKKLFFRGLSRTMTLMPYVSNIVAISAIWMVILSPYGGPLNAILKIFGMKNPPLWIASPKMALPTIAVVAAWHSLAFDVIVFLAGLQEIPEELYEAAEVDGALGWHKFIYVTLPCISPTTFFILITSIINSFQNYAIIRNMTNGGPGVATRVTSFNIYEDAFSLNKFSFASAQAVMLFAVIFIITIIQWRGQKKWVNY